MDWHAAIQVRDKGNERTRTGRRDLQWVKDKTRRPNGRSLDQEKEAKSVQKGRSAFAQVRGTSSRDNRGNETGRRGSTKKRRRKRGNMSARGLESFQNSVLFGTHNVVEIEGRREPAFVAPVYADQTFERKSWACGGEMDPGLIH